MTFQRLFIFGFVAASGLWQGGARGQTAARGLTSYVDPYIGSGGHGHVFVGASVPFGAVQLGPDNFYKGWDWCYPLTYLGTFLCLIGRYFHGLLVHPRDQV
jgi:putative alpha-1,2-mannosidase